MQLSGKKAFISGSTQGIGYAIAKALLAEGVDVTINGRSEARLHDAMAQLKTSEPGGTISGIVADFSDLAETERLLERLDDVDILVNNVGLFDQTPFQDIPDSEWQHYFEVNVMSGVRLSRHVLGGMIARNWGRIIFIGSESGVNIPADMVHYGLTKPQSTDR